MAAALPVSVQREIFSFIGDPLLASGPDRKLFRQLQLLEWLDIFDLVGPARVIGLSHLTPLPLAIGMCCEWMLETEPLVRDRLFQL